MHSHSRIIYMTKPGYKILVNMKMIILERAVCLANHNWGLQEIVFQKQ